MKVMDMHCDTIGRLHQTPGKNLLENDFHIDLHKMMAGDYLLQNFAVFIHLESYRDPYQACHDMMDTFYREIQKNKDKIGAVYRMEDIEENQRNNKISALLTIEEGGVCQGSLEKLREFYERGARMMTLTWNYENEIGFPAAIAQTHGNGDEFGLKPFGIELVQEMETLGMIPDVSHLSDAGFYDVAKYTKKPFVASHSNVRALCGHARNLTDDMIRLLGERGGVTGLNFCSLFLEDDGEFSTLETTAKHAAYLKNVGGIGCVALGSDFDGIQDTLEIKNASGMPRLADALKKEGFTESEVEAVFYRNVWNLYKEWFS